MWWNLIGMAVKTGAEVYKNRQESKALESQAQKLHYERMARGEIEYQGKIMDSNSQSWKDEFVLILISIPILLLGWSVFSDDEEIKVKLDTFFTYFGNLPLWYQALFVGVVSAIYGLKGADIFKRK
jgi:hypothetical protein